MPDNFWMDLWEAAKLAGPFGTLFALMIWWLERQERLQERIRLREIYTSMLERVLLGLEHSAAATEKLSELFSRKRGG